MNPRRAPRLALALLRCIARTAYRESLEGDLLEELAAGRSMLWYWQQMFCALWEQVRRSARQQSLAFTAVTAFFLLALWAIAPATYPVMSWAPTTEPLHTLVLLGWLAGVPLLLGGIAGASQRTRRMGAILLGAGLVYVSPVSRPFDLAVCDLCSGPGSAATSTAVFMTPLASALLAGLGAWMIGRIRHTATREQP